MTTIRWSLLLASALAAAACSPPVTPDAGDVAEPDASVDVAREASQPDAADVPVDTGAPHVRAEYATCTSAADCLDGWMCLRNTDGFPGGWCTRPCTTVADCEGVLVGVESLCPTVTSGPRLCRRRCLNGYDCGREGGYTCVPLSATANVCTPSCDDATCGAGATCNPWTGRCLPAGTPPAPGADVGERCTRTGMGSECRSSQCNVEVSTTSGLLTGWNGGYCLGTCALPAGWNSSSLWPTPTFPRGNCPMGSICFPGGQGLAQHDLGTCLRECRSNADCRAAEGYYCRRTFNRNRTQPYTWMNGYCAPMDCNAAGMTCPAGLTCEIQMRMSGGMVIRVGVCRTPPVVPDAGPDAPVTDVPVADVSGDRVESDPGSSDAAEGDAGLDGAAD